jgi:nucleotide-binding universal stress UspA family protein/GNAT superfamily N-acetyltransferase
VSAPSQPVPLRDGSRIEIRPIRGEDRDALRAGFEQLSAESRYRRFFGPMHELSARDLDYLTDVDHHDHEALVAADIETGDGVGVARFVRTGDAVAEPAMVVLDAWQGRGVGLALLEALAARAIAEGVTRFEAPVLATNTDAIRLLERLGETTKQRSGRELQLTIELPAPGVVDPRWRTLLSTFASGALEPGRTVLERLWPRRPGSPDDERVNVILVGVDGTEHSLLALEHAADLALATGARVEVAGVHRFLTAGRDELSGTIEDAVQSLRERGLEASGHLLRGDAALVLTDLATELQARLLVVGSAQRSKGARRIIGSVSDTVAERSPCNVLIVRPGRTAG